MRSLRQRRGTRRIVVALACGCVPLVAPAAAHALPQISVRASAASEIEPDAAGRYFVWASAPRSRPAKFSVYVREGKRRPYRVSSKRRRAFSWGGAIHGGLLVYSQFAGRTANLRFYDLDARRHVSVPAGVNTGLSENGASRSGNWLLFRRTRFSDSRERIVLRNLVTHEERLLASRTGRAYAQPGNVAGNFATWYECHRPRRCTIWLYEIAAGTRRRVPNPGGKAQYAVSVTADGTVYFAESGNLFCGANRRLLRWRPGGSRRVLSVFPRNRDPGVSSVRENPNGTTTVYFDRASCSSGRSDIYRIVEPAP